MIVLLLFSCSNTEKINHKDDQLNQETSNNSMNSQPHLLWSNLIIDFKNCNQQDTYVACYSDLEDKTQYFFTRDSYDSIKNYNSLYLEESINIDEAKVFYLDIYKKHEEEWIMNIDYESYIGKYHQNAILYGKKAYNHWLLRYTFLWRSSYDDSIKELKKQNIGIEKLSKDNAILSNESYHQLWNIIKISWNKYSNLKKTDKDFYLILWKFWWEIKIIEEYSWIK